MTSSTEPEKRHRFALVLVAVAIPAVVLGYLGQFNRFNWYDDEGYAMMGVKHILDGHRLYDDVISFYGPAYNLFKVTVHEFLGVPFTHDNVRLTGLVLLLISSLIAPIGARGAYRWVLLFGVVFLYLRPAFYREPCHPLELVALALCAVPGASSFVTSRPVLSSIAIGACAALGGLTKINVGAFMVAGALLAFVLFAVAYRPRLAVLVLLLASLSPLALTHRHINQSWPAAVTVLTAVGIATVFIASWQELRRHDVRLPAGRMIASLLASGLVISILMSAFFFARGSTPAGMYESLIKISGSVPDAVAIPELGRLREVGAAVVLSLGLAAYLRLNATAHPQAVVVAKLLVGFASLAIGATARPIAGMMLAPCAWLAVLSMDDGASVEEHRRRVASRIIVAAIAVFQTLQAYPVAGSQRILGSVLIVYLGAVMLLDAAAWMSHHRVRLSRFVLPMAATILLAAFVHQLWGAATLYRRNVPAELPGASRLRLPAAQVELLHWLTRVIREESSAMVAAPGMNSLYFWSQTEPPTLDLITITDHALTPQQQQNLLDAVAKAERPLVLTQRIIGKEAQEKTVGSGEPSALEQRLRADYEIAAVVPLTGYPVELQMRRRPGDAKIDVPPALQGNVAK